MENDVIEDIISYHNEIYRELFNESLIREFQSFQENRNLCCEIELPKEKKSEKPKFNQTKK